MRKYDIYEMKVNYCWIDDFHIMYTETPFVCLGYLEGCQAVYDYLKYQTVVNSRSFHDKDAINKTVYTCATQYGLYTLRHHVEHRRYYYIEDEFGRLRNFNELTYNAKKSCQTHKHCRQARHYHGKNNHQEQRQSITPQEVRDISDEYNIHMCPIKTKRVFDAWDNDGWFKISKSWKDQSKRKHQFKHPKKGS